MATMRSQQRREAGSFAALRINRSRPILRITPSAAATWPCGNERSTSSSCGPVPTTVPPFSTAFNVSIISRGNLLRLANVRFCE